MEVKARPAGAATGDVGSGAITGGHTTTISLDIVCMRIGNTERHPGTIYIYIYIYTYTQTYMYIYVYNYTYVYV